MLDMNDDAFEAQLIESSFDRFIEVTSGARAEGAQRHWLRASEIESLEERGQWTAVRMSSGCEFIVDQSPAEIVAAIQGPSVDLPNASVTVLPGGRGRR